MNILSLFDGLSGAQLALKRAGIKVDKYFASEIDKFAIQVAKKNFPEMMHLGDVREIDVNELPKIDVLIGGSPCQSFSFAGRQAGMSTKTKEQITTLAQYQYLSAMGFEFIGQSYLFWEYVRILKELKEVNPNLLFLLENVNMKKEWEEVITNTLGVEPVRINSSLLCAQNRKRLYWTNMPAVIEQPKHNEKCIEDVLEDPNLVPVIKSYGDLIYKPHKAQCLDANYHKGADNRGQRTGCIEVGHAEINGHDFLKRVYSVKGKSPTLTAVCGGNQERKIAIDAQHWRKLTPLECERLQTVPDNYTEGVSNTQRYKMIGNGFTIDVIAYILIHMFPEDFIEIYKEELFYKE